MWQHVKLSVQIRPWDTLACCWDVKQPTNKQTNKPHPQALTLYALNKSFRTRLVDLLPTETLYVLFFCQQAQEEGDEDEKMEEEVK